jgi:hypothetical protein
MRRRHPELDDPDLAFVMIVFGALVVILTVALRSCNL